MLKQPPPQKRALSDPSSSFPGAGAGKQAPVFAIPVPPPAGRKVHFVKGLIWSEGQILCFVICS